MADICPCNQNECIYIDNTDAFMNDNEEYRDIYDNLPFIDYTIYRSQKYSNYCYHIKWYASPTIFHRRLLDMRIGLSHISDIYEIIHYEKYVGYMIECDSTTFINNKDLDYAIEFFNLKNMNADEFRDLPIDMYRVAIFLEIRRSKYGYLTLRRPTF
jgi:hypothetical protein